MTRGPASSGRWLLAALSLAIMVARLSPARGTDERAPPAGPPPLTELHSVGGVLSTTLVAAPGKLLVGDLDLDGMVYNGLYAGPVLRLHPGDTLRVHLVNNLAEPTNLHFHGLHTSPRENADNVHLAVPAGASFDYVVPIPASQPPGLYWYHAHLHGISEAQVMGGLSGALVVEGLAEQFPQLAGIGETLLVLKEMTFEDDTGNPRIDDDLHGIVQTINGALHVDLAMRPGETRLWRITNQSANRYMHLALAGHRFQMIAEDGNPVTSAQVAEVLDIKPAGRIEALVQAGAPGRYALVSRGAPSGTGDAASPDRTLGTLSVAGEPAAMLPLPTAFPPSPDLRGAAIDAARTVVFTQTTARTPKAQRFFVNGRLFDAERVDFRVPLGNVEEWTIRNDSDDMHVFHIHQVSFQVVAVNGSPVPFTGRLDVVRVPERGSVTLRMAFTDRMILGRFMFHCHVLRHEDQGMMAQIEVYDPRAAQAPSRRGPRAGLRLFARHVWRWLCGVPWHYCGDDRIG